MTILFFLARFSGSGVPLAQIRLAKSFVRRGHHVDFFIGYVPDGMNIPPVTGINFIHANKKRVINLFFPIAKFLRAHTPDIVFSAEDHLNAIVLFAAIITNSKAKFSVSSRVTPYDTYSNTLLSKRWFLKKIISLVQHRADALVCVSKDMVAQYKTIFPDSRHDYAYNVIYDMDSESKKMEPICEQWISDCTVPLVISAGRLAQEKGFSDLITAFKIVRKSIDASLVILGDGPLREKLELQIRNYGLNANVHLIGFRENPLKYFIKSDVFVLSSYVEGLPNVLVEAMMCGCSIVSTDCPTGPREVLQDGEFGTIVPMRAPEAMASAISHALESPSSNELFASAIKPFMEENVLARHGQLLGEDFLTPIHSVL
ncbi:Glycosyltransferase involved in cell wall bisynthesis [Candidatus Electrothrix aarhusensis]|uniref:Glycosyltransferase involved in cell wall bisynthesis n=1 Tax=Candidatus Electrothrix aarhusensis TaxID=1859131 RepID=A0A3S3QCJ6_9BACT|nr:Glycosyltransferase involved in cell wall bisynthesis [Candidatus Electrothrix aarhusensis]